MTPGTNDVSASVAGSLAAIWGVLGTVAILGFAIARLMPMTLAALRHDLRWFHVVALALCVAFMLYAEGYRGFQRSFSPRVARRAAALRRNPTWLTALLAPLFCIGYFRSEPRLKLTVYGLTAAIVVLVLLVHRLDQPWRGIIDAGVVAGLTWGSVATLVASRDVLRASRGAARDDDA